MSRASKIGLAASRRLEGNPLWDREFHAKILNKLHKGITQSQLRELQFGRNGKFKSRLMVENEAVIEIMKKRGKGSLRKHPPVGVDHRITGREPIVPILESVLDMNMFISDTGNIHSDKEAIAAAKRFAASLEDREHQLLELERLHRAIHSQAAGTSTNTTMAKFRTYFERSMVFYLLSSSMDKHGQVFKSKSSTTSRECHEPEDYLRESLRDICMAIKIRDDIAPSYYNRALVLRKLRCHEAACGDIDHALKLLHYDVGNNELAMMKYRKLAALLERELGLFVESGMEYQKIKELNDEHKEHEKRKLILEKQKKLARRMKNGNERFKIEEIAKNKVKTNFKSFSKLSKKFFPTLKSPNSKSNGQKDDKPKKREGLLKLVHQVTGGKHLSTVLKAKSKFLRGLMTPIAKAMAGTIAGERTVPEIERIVNFIYSTRSDDLTSLDQKSLRKICQWFGHESVAAGHYVFKQGQPQNAFYVLASGMAQVMVVHPKLGYEVPVKTLYPGDTFGRIYFPTHEEIKMDKKKGGLLDLSISGDSNDNLDSSGKNTNNQTVGKEGEDDCVGSRERHTRREGSILSRTWASDSVDRTGHTRRASIYASRHCELLCLKWEHKIETGKEGLMTNFEHTKHQRHEEAIRAFQDHTVNRRLMILKNCTVFKHMTEKDLQRLATIGSIHQWHQGKSLIYQGEVLNKVYILVRGVCEVLKRREISVVQNEAKQMRSPTGGGEDPIAAGMMWKQQYNQHMSNRLHNLVNANREDKLAKVNELNGIPAQWVKVGILKVGDICGEFCLLNPSQSTVSPVEVIADTCVDALVFNLGELKPFINHGIFSGRTRMELINSIGMHVPSELKVTCDLSAVKRWNLKKSSIVKKHVVGHRHLHPVGSILDKNGRVIRR
jgi:CRP-like cAMP-binding protein/tetratricopeptide (TPR) repeat protein